MLEIIAVLLLILWLLGMVSSQTVGGFTYTNDTHRTDISALNITLDGNPPENNSAQK